MSNLQFLNLVPGKRHNWAAIERENNLVGRGSLERTKELVPHTRDQDVNFRAVRFLIFRRPCGRSRKESYHH